MGRTLELHRSRESYEKTLLISQILTTAGIGTEVTAYSDRGFDALPHPVERYLSLDAISFSDIFARKAIRLINDSLLADTKNGDHRETRINCP